MTGTIKSLPAEKRFGFIMCSDLEKDLFFHESALVGVSFDALKLGDTVSFETEEGQKGLNAINVQLAA